MNVNELLDTIEDTLEESAGMPLSGGKRIVDVEQIRDYLDETVIICSRPRKRRWRKTPHRSKMSVQTCARAPGNSSDAGM